MSSPTAQAPVATALITAATELHRSARAHKQAAAAHRRAAQRDMQALESLRVECARLGIRLDIVQSPQEAQTDGQ
jgi:hypothetical protein